MLSDSPLADLLEKLRNSEAGPLLGRLEELRGRIIKLMVFIFGLFIVCFVFAKETLLWLEGPLAKALPQGAKVLHFTGPMEVFVAYVQVSFTITLIFSLPAIFLQLWNFVKPALPPVGRGMVIPFFVASLTLFASGVAFCFYVMMPVALEYLITMGRDVAIPVIMVSDYVSLIVFMLLGFGGVFQLPVVLIILERLGVINLALLTTSRRYVIVLIVVVAAIVTPTPDPFSQMAMAIPMYVMFEAAIIIIRILQKRDRKAAANLPIPK